MRQNQKLRRGPPRFKRERKNSISRYAHLFDHLEEMLFEQFARLGIDPHDLDAMGELLARNLSESSEGDPGETNLLLESKKIAAKAMENLISMRLGHIDDELIVDRLCSTHLYLGLLAGTDDFEPQYICPSCAVRQHSSEIGRKGIQERHAPMRKLKAWAIEKYRSKSWPSANAAAYALMDDIIGYGRTIGADLKESNAQRTIAEWFRKSV